MEILEKLFGSGAKVKVIKLFLFNPETAYDASQVAERAHLSMAVARKEISNLEKAGFLREKSYSKEVRVQKNRRSVLAHKRANGWMLEYKFSLLEPLYNFLSDINVYNPDDLIAKLSKGAKLSLLIISGLFIKNPDSRVDLLIVGDNIKENVLETTIKNIEAEIGREIKYVIFTTADFKYRQSVFDRLVRDILDYPHQKLVNKLGV
jgi:hypothetical protein